MNKQEAFSYLLHNVSEQDGKFIFVNHTPIFFLKQIAVGLPSSDLAKLKEILGDSLFKAIVVEISRDRSAVTSEGYSIAVSGILTSIENMQSENVISFSFPTPSVDKVVESSTKQAEVIDQWLKENSNV